MELVQGIPLAKYCDDEHLTVPERLNLFIPICNAVQHAHQKGIIHRDLKPSNILVGLYDGQPVPKVIDFGIAKATEQKLTDNTLLTEFGQVIGTLAYMAPEQADTNNLDFDTRADIYSLGVILYELLTGSPPFSAKQLNDAGFDEARRVIREVDPPILRRREPHLRLRRRRLRQRQRLHPVPAAVRRVDLKEARSDDSAGSTSRCGSGPRWLGDREVAGGVRSGSATACRHTRCVVIPIATENRHLLMPRPGHHSVAATAHGQRQRLHRLPPILRRREPHLRLRRRRLRQRQRLHPVPAAVRRVDLKKHAPTVGRIHVAVRVGSPARWSRCCRAGANGSRTSRREPTSRHPKRWRASNLVKSFRCSNGV